MVKSTSMGQMQNAEQIWEQHHIKTGVNCTSSQLCIQKCTILIIYILTAMPIYCSAQAPRGKLMPSNRLLPSKAQNPIISNLQKIYICTIKDFKNY